MKANEILEAVAATIIQRGAQNGYDNKEERSAAEIARSMVQRTGGRVQLTEADVWRTCMSLKEVRLNAQLENGSDPTDTLIDLIGYTVLLAECLTEKQ